MHSGACATGSSIWQHVSPSAHAGAQVGIAQWPFRHIFAEAGHSCPQRPQLKGSLFGSTHTESQHESPAVHVPLGHAPPPLSAVASAELESEAESIVTTSPDEPWSEVTSAGGPSVSRRSVRASFDPSAPPSASSKPPLVPLQLKFTAEQSPRKRTQTRMRRKRSPRCRPRQPTGLWHPRASRPSLTYARWSHRRVPRTPALGRPPRSCESCTP
jgi:hypothetical protein